jgi:hypothetical protein
MRLASGNQQIGRLLGEMDPISQRQCSQSRGGVHRVTDSWNRALSPEHSSRYATVQTNTEGQVGGIRAENDFELLREHVHRGKNVSREAKP